MTDINSQLTGIIADVEQALAEKTLRDHEFEPRCFLRLVVLNIEARATFVLECTSCARAELACTWCVDRLRQTPTHPTTCQGCDTTAPLARLVAIRPLGGAS
jgi:hypothetical protein